MNVVQSDILLFLKNNEFNNQREMAGKLNYSLGLINKELRVLEKNVFIGHFITVKLKFMKILYVFYIIFPLCLWH